MQDVQPDAPVTLELQFGMQEGEPMKHIQLHQIDFQYAGKETKKNSWSPRKAVLDGTFRFLFWAGLTLSSAASATPYSDAVLADGPIAYWQFEETSGTTAVDTVGSHSGTYVGGVTLGQEGAFNGSLAALFDGTNDYVAINSGSWGGSQLTVEAWFNLGHATDDFEAIVSSTGFQFVHLQLRAQPTNPGKIAVYTNTGNLFFDTLSDELDGWHHVALTLASGDSNLYLDGELIETQTGTFNNVFSASSIRIGSGFYGGRFFNGLIDEVAIYAKALTSDRIAAHYAAAQAPLQVPEPAPLLLGGIGILFWSQLRRRRFHPTR